MTNDIAMPLAEQRPRGTARGPLEAAARATDPAQGARSLYIHVPFCAHKCHYCDFYSIVDRQDRQEAFTRRLIRELGALAPFAGTIETIFVGGGTPTLLAPALWRELLDALHDRFDLSRVRAGEAEFSVECNPETASPELFDTLRAGGVSRISIGAQSFNPDHLKTLERWHDPDNVARSINLARAAGIQRQSLDLIFGVPGQSLDDWSRDLERVLELGTEHLSCYALTYEPNTAMTARLERDEFTRTDEDLEADMYELTLERLTRAGLERYEVSNFALAGRECAHNLAYWRQEDWLAAGPSASGHIAGHRWKNTARLDDYLRTDDEGFSPIMDHEPPDGRRAVSERIMTGIRLREGLEITRTCADAERVAPGARRRLETTARWHTELGLLEISGGRWVLTDAGFLMGDRVAAELMSALG
mgnify:CR=1 FL=1|jgi:oxygen-independent coproporphyrinogen-3 oxidase